MNGISKWPEREFYFSIKCKKTTLIKLRNYLNQQYQDYDIVKWRKKKTDVFLKISP